MPRENDNDLANCIIPINHDNDDPCPIKGNSNSNSNENENFNLNGNANLNCNSNHNSNENNIENGIYNKVNTEVNVKVDVDVDVGHHSAPVIDLSHFAGTDSVVIADTGNQTIYGGGNAFHIDQVNNLVNNGNVDHPSVSYSNGSGGYEGAAWHPGGEFHMEAHASSGNATSSGGTVGDVVGAAANGIVSHADATVTQSAFDQTITTGANIQFNSLTMNVAGHDYTDSHNLGHS